MLDNKIFVFPHSAPFAKQMRCSIRSGSDYGDGDYDRRNPPEKTTYALMRCNRQFESHTFGIPCKKGIFKPFKLVLNDAPMMSCDSMSVSSEADHSLLRFICAIEIKSIYNGKSVIRLRIGSVSKTEFDQMVNISFFPFSSR